MKPAVMHFDFGRAAVRVLMTGDAPWFVAADVCDALGYANSRDALAKHLDADEKGVAICDTPCGRQRLQTISESGLYALALRSHKSEARPFAKWVTREVLPSIRKTGEYRASWTRNRHQAAASYRVMNEVLRLTREAGGKATGQHHYSNEARLINYVLRGAFAGLERNTLCEADLALLAYLEERNAVMLARGVEYAARKPMLAQYALDWRMQREAALAVYGQAI